MPSISERDLAWAWWTCIQEPEDAHAHALRLHLGLIESIEWVCADSPGPLPPPLSQQRKTFEDAWKRFKPRALRNDVNQELAAIHALGGRFISQEDPSFPKELNILQESTPLGLWVVGTLPHTRSVTIVGARATTNLGIRNAFDIASDLADRGDTILSGGAFGIDIAAHRGTLAANGQTIAILAGGVANPYPISHTRDFETIVESSGAIVSEVPPSFRPAKWRFLGRNRMLAAWGDATIVIEASSRSGALATARRAMTLGKPVGAVPGPITSQSSMGCHELIRNGATLIRNASDIHEMIDPLHTQLQGTLFGEPVCPDQGVNALSPHARRAWEALPIRNLSTLSNIAANAGMSEQETLRALAELELEGYVRSHSRGWARKGGARC